MSDTCCSCIDIYQSPPDCVDLEIKRGQSWALPVTLTNAGTNAPVDITGFTGYAKFAKVDGTSVVDLTYTEISAADGQFTLSLTFVQTLVLPLNTTIQWDCFLSDGTTSIAIFEGNVTVEKNIATPA